MLFDKLWHQNSRIHMWNQHYNQNIENICHSPNFLVLLCNASASPSPPAYDWSAFCHYKLIWLLKRIWYKWNNTHDFIYILSLDIIAEYPSMLLDVSIIKIFFFNWRVYSSLWTDYNLPTHSTTDRHFWCFQFVTTKNKSTKKNATLSKSLYGHNFYISWVKTEEEWKGVCGRCMLTTLRTCQTLFQSDYTLCDIPTSRVWELFYILPSTWFKSFKCHAKQFQVLICSQTKLEEGIIMFILQMKNPRATKIRWHIQIMQWLGSEYHRMMK